ncbi:c-type cytochrome [Jannaschia sp. Os4]|uniref:c-type cytochrome n=1 Tax=Jannaschia sp. Os4 TaxID=2807617 RepID=UPI001939EAEA|nr:c-type cytochrome [Jannaschia sp. Os4]MBM2576313.1 c-type cytochrome [Jannaschia sp. Os4]
MSKLGDYLLPALGGTAIVLSAGYWQMELVRNAAWEGPVYDSTAYARARAALIAKEREAEALRAEATAARAEATALAEKAAILTTGTAGLVLAAAAPPAPEAGFGLGRPALEEEVAAWDIDIRPDGQGLPVGSGDVFTGEEVWVERCAVCHGDFGEAVGRWPVIAGGFGTLDGEDPVKTTGSYWPYLSTVWDYVHRAMPFGEAQSLTDDEVYALTAYILYSNDLVDDDFELSDENFAEVSLPNEDGFFMDDRPDTELSVFTGEPCMSDCTDGPVEITMRSMVLDVTPDSGVVTEAAAALDDGNGITESDASAEVAAVVNADADEVAAEATGEAGEAVVEASQEASDGDATATVPLDPELVAAGEKAFRQCSSCHQVGEGATNRSGPALTGIVGAPMGAVEGFRYSNALVEKGEAGEVWSHENLTAFLAAPKDWLPGTKMSFRGLRDASDADAIIAYLESVAP